MLSTVCRLVPLSEGRVESDGTLQCAYHGWRFGDDGQCTRVPQAESQEEQLRIVRQKKACVTTFPTQVLLLFPAMGYAGVCSGMGIESVPAACNNTCVAAHFAIGITLYCGVY